jgi:cob(I)alamin adenosyltransferase
MSKRVYTKKGDTGTTSLLSGIRVSKVDYRIQSVGVLDELNSFIGLLRAEVREFDSLEEIQWNLFNAGSNVINDTDTELINVTEEDILKLEITMDEMSKTLPELKNFILPKGNKAQAYSHICRTICRRAESVVLNVVGEDATHWPARLEIIVRYLNRLSDFFFVLARYIGEQERIEESIWKNKK